MCGLSLLVGVGRPIGIVGLGAFLVHRSVALRIHGAPVKLFASSAVAAYHHVLAALRTLRFVSV